jgi:hypothetical protein
MVSYFTPISYNVEDDTEFINKMVDGFKKLIAFMPEGKFAQTIASEKLQFEGKAEVTQTIVLDLFGSAVYLYMKLFKEPYPKNPSKLQIEKMNAIWVGIGHPENIIPT